MDPNFFMEMICYQDTLIMNSLHFFNAWYNILLLRNQHVYIFMKTSVDLRPHLSFNLPLLQAYHFRRMYIDEGGCKIKNVGV